MNEIIEIPFDAKYSELGGWEYNIPEGYTASIENGKIIVKKEESEDERIRKELTEFLKSASGGFLDTAIQCKTFGKWATWLEKQGEQNPAWNEEDENILEAIIYTVRNSGYSHCIGVSIEVMINWLKSLKDRVQPQSKQEWSEEDCLQLDAATNIVANSGHICTADWLKSLKDRMKGE